MITDFDLKLAKAKNEDDWKEEDWTERAQDIIDGFDALENEQDRRILYEVLGMRIFEEEFRDETENYSSYVEDCGDYLMSSMNSSSIANTSK